MLRSQLTGAMNELVTVRNIKRVEFYKCKYVLISIGYCDPGMSSMALVEFIDVSYSEFLYYSIFFHVISFSV